ncbi:hypothetical protein F511_17199 [Dorcoceras hygrometricum]|uniref:Uncharacterized protein n=1 Tax=Dorcoceras hygrometricum TaxID=472368 RepID=A0A2Z7DAE5_9LAMI|nr:hypothetical protein F511_17199 [Dorcoceras hygrometricum]
MVTPGSKQAKGFAIQISLLLDSFPNLELGEPSEFPSSKILADKTIQRYISIIDKSGEQEPAVAPKVKKAPKTKVASKKRPTDFSLDVPMLKKKDVEEEIHFGNVEVPAEETRCSSADDVDVIIQQRHWFDLPYEDLIEKWAAERPMVTASDTDEEVVLMDVGTAGEDQQVQEPVAQISNDDFLDADEQKSLDDILLSIPVDVPLPSTGMEITKIVMGQEIKIPGVTEKTWFLSSLPQIPVDHKGKAILVEKDPIKGNPAQEHFFLICADIDLLVELRANIIDEVAQFFHSFSLRKLATFNLEDMYKKEEQVLSWGETESPQVAIQRKLYILIKYREVLVRKFLESWRANFVPGQGSTAVDLKVINLLTDLHLSILEELANEARAHGLLWTKTCCSTIFEGSPGDRGDVIARTNMNTRSSCWIRTMILVDGVWTVEPCADKWVKIPRQAISNAVPRQRQYDDTLPSMSPFFQVLKKRWADVCFEVVDFCASRRLLPFSLDQRPSSPTTADSSSSLHFDVSDVDATASSLPPVSQDFSAALADLQAILSEQIYESQSGISSKMHKIDQAFLDSMHEQAAVVKKLFHRGLQQPSNVQMSASAERTPTFAQIVEMAQRHIVHTVLDADANRELLERQAAAERDRERRRR